MRIPTRLWLGFLLASTIPTLHAQERAAGGNLRSEASWAALQALIGKAQGDIDIVEIDVNAIKKCSKQGKIFNGTTCINATVTTDARISKIITCGNQGKVYSQTGDTCLEVTGGTRWISLGAGPSASGGLSRSGVKNNFERNLKSAGLWYCASSVGLARKCSNKGEKCVMSASSSETRGDKNEHEHYTYTSTVYQCN